MIPSAQSNPPQEQAEFPRQQSAELQEAEHPRDLAQGTAQEHVQVEIEQPRLQLTRDLGVLLGPQQIFENEALKEPRKNKKMKNRIKE